MPEPLLIAKSGDTELTLLPALANRHGLITGATGTGKTVTLRTLAQAFSSIGVLGSILGGGSKRRQIRSKVISITILESTRNGSRHSRQSGIGRRLKQGTGARLCAVSRA